MFNQIIELLYPRKCINCRKFGNFICTDCFSRITYSDNFCCPICQKLSVNGMTHPVCMSTWSLNGAIWAVSYGAVVKKLIYQFKYNPHLSSLKATIGKIMVEGLSQNESLYSYIEKYKPTLIPIPLSVKRMRQRGYNHAELLSYYVAQYFSLKINTKILLRVRDTKPQYKLNKRERSLNVQGAFEVSKLINKKEIHQLADLESIILIDDIATSFSTLREACKVLKRSGAKRVLAVTFAREV